MGNFIILTLNDGRALAIRKDTIAYICDKPNNSGSWVGLATSTGDDSDFSVVEKYSYILSKLSDPKS